MTDQEKMKQSVIFWTTLLSQEEQPEQQAEPVAAESITDAIMNLVDRLGSESKQVDLRAWPHLLVYAPQRKPLTDAEIEAKFLTCNGRWDGDRWVIEDADFHPFVRAITALRAQLEQPKGLFIDMIAAHGPKFVEEVRRVGENIEQQDEPVAWNKSIRDSVDSLLEQAGYQPDSSARHQLAMMNFDATSPQRKPLTIDDIQKLVLAAHGNADWTVVFARAIEQAHGIKETP
jgi:hypothetical protein